MNLPNFQITGYAKAGSPGTENFVDLWKKTSDVKRNGAWAMKENARFQSKLKRKGSRTMV